MSSSKKTTHKSNRLLLVLVFMLLYLNAFAQAQLSVLGNGNEIRRFSASFQSDNYTNYGVVFNEEDDVDANQISKTFTIENNGNEDLEITNISLVDAHNFFDITTNTTATLEQGESQDLTINFNANKFGVGFARVIIDSDDPDGEFFFYIKAKNILCDGSFDCYGVSANDPTACSGNGTCIAANTCECVDLVTGTNCQIPLRWSNGKLTASASFDFDPRIFYGPEISDPNNVYEFRIRINAIDIFPGSLGISVGLFNDPPPDPTHDIGYYGNEYGYLGGTGQKFFSGDSEPYGDKFSKDDIVTIIYDAPNQELFFTVQRPGLPVAEQGLAYSGVQTVVGKSLYMGLSVNCFGNCQFEIVN
ncbi:MAG: hypothetical protein HWE21_01555 [Cytophagia bacterium]|nr:hypothetical protein [Cytophagia bacterium]